ncbi:lysophospholipid acyltransferase family protein [Marinitenerispora sediminis]|uniref:1-acyl-sn-glycerol-3-phosphate acyltransferase n=1 Tax=Marinitenerispora sediminis TaxID=1931232 RepID=A0A368T150_9ACTN|nr:lysophospholipid acyltransferase family protein [Marinitenerispora sediminis]RCV53216.1 1-acyl-sn-glycerol-3-phosphate acyltransferase [Marinitenerispora sediminis]RCV56523.1 1-acyl-sn-glycerol-3-phosphate acyltransferase [Marinitenerispora sediminis]RCV60126.1 1-acyl-sn-glycerol-3-phosphate acyltransferase [Marinitenerispora sediminis]
MSIYGAAKSVIAPVTRTLWSPQVTGLRHIPPHGPVILASNHLSNFDPVLIGVVVPRPVVFLAKRELFAEGNLAQRTFTRALRAIGQLSTDRGTGAREAMDSTLDLLAEGRAVGIFPEGSRSPDGRLYRGQTGLAWLALSTGAPVVPMAVTGTAHVLPAGRRIPSFHRLGVRIGPVVDLAPWHGEAGRARSRRAATDAVMDAIHALSGQPRAERFAASAKARPAARAS